VKKKAMFRGDGRKKAVLEERREKTTTTERD